MDGYSENPHVLGEIYFRIGKSKSAQLKKSSKDVLKILLIEKMLGTDFRKIIAFADDGAADSFAGGESWYSQLKHHFNIEILIVTIPNTLRNNLLAAQNRQKRKS